MTDEHEFTAPDPDLPEIIEEGTNPGWRIRVGVSRQFVEALDEAEQRGIWFDTEAEMDAFVHRRPRARARAGE